ncbi:MAG: hypothetical protein JKY33_10810 [Bacteroidia bacterium]|nr:hypothetical protein [Bacteroidia bacterium]
MNADFKYDLGDKARDIVTGFTGVITSRADNISGCDIYMLTATDLDVCAFDEDRLTIIKKKAVVIEKNKKPAPISSAPWPIGPKNNNHKRR